MVNSPIARWQKRPSIMSHMSHAISCRVLRLALTGIACLSISSVDWPSLSAAEVRYYEQDGIKYRETRQIVQRPVSEVVWEDRPQTVYAEQWKPETRSYYRTVERPVIEYRWETYWANRWNPLAEPYLAWRQVPYTRIETKTEEQRARIVVRQVVPQTRTVKVPITKHKLIEEEQITRVVVSNRTPADPFAQPLEPRQGIVAARPVTIPPSAAAPGLLPPAALHGSAALARRPARMTIPPTPASTPPAFRPLPKIGGVKRPPGSTGGAQWRPAQQPLAR